MGHDSSHLGLRPLVLTSVYFHTAGLDPDDPAQVRNVSDLVHPMSNPYRGRAHQVDNMSRLPDGAFLYAGSHPGIFGPFATLREHVMTGRYEVQ